MFYKGKFTCVEEWTTCCLIWIKDFQAKKTIFFKFKISIFHKPGLASSGWFGNNFLDQNFCVHFMTEKIADFEKFNYD